MRISDWSSDVCSSDLLERVALVEDVVDQQHAPPLHRRGGTMQPGQPRAGGVAAVAGGVQVVELDVEPALAERERQLRRERHAAVHDGDEQRRPRIVRIRSEEHTSELQSLMRNSYAVFCLKKKKPN